MPCSYTTYCIWSKSIFSSMHFQHLLINVCNIAPIFLNEKFQVYKETKRINLWIPISHVLHPDLTIWVFLNNSLISLCIYFYFCWTIWKLQTFWHFPPKYFSMQFLKIVIFLHSHSFMITSMKLSSNSISYNI